MGPSGQPSSIFFFLIFLTSLTSNCPVIAHSFDEKSVMPNQREDLFSSTSKLADMVENELQVVDLLDTFAEYIAERAQTIKM